MVPGHIIHDSFPRKMKGTVTNKEGTYVYVKIVGFDHAATMAVTGTKETTKNNSWRNYENFTAGSLFIFSFVGSGDRY